MKFATLSVLIGLSFATVSATAASFDCPVPAFPSVSTSSEGVRRVERQVKAWRTCYEANRAEHKRIEVTRMNDEVDAALEKWLASTRYYSRSMAVGAGTLSRIERDRLEHMSVRYAEGSKTAGANQHQ
jgi:hypothetical protein